MVDKLVATLGASMLTTAQGNVAISLYERWLDMIDGTLTRVRCIHHLGICQNHPGYAGAAADLDVAHISQVAHRICESHP